jgi:hypothetical protein
MSGTTQLNYNTTGEPEGSPPEIVNTTLYGPNYSITQAAGWASINTNLTFANWQVNISGDTITGDVVNNQWSVQTLSFGWDLDLTGQTSVAWDASATFMGPEVDNNGTISVADANVHIDSSVLGGDGMTFLYAGYEEVQASTVGSGQSFDLTYGSLQIDRPAGFGGTIDLGNFSTVNLPDFTGADSFSYANNVLTLWNGSSQIASLKVADTGTSGPLAVYASSEYGGVGVAISNNPYVGGPALPQHVPAA